uniref:Uncharacterized protein n=1 Tax=Meloidogyne incognita TaxID=6306 RepID=A0A914NVJ5_MELIC
MDLIVSTAGGSIQSVSGVNENTTCAQIVYVLAHARQQKGRFTLIARLNGSDQEHRFTPDERPYEFIMECNEQGVQPEFELLKLDIEKGDDGGQLNLEPCTQNMLSTNSSTTSVDAMLSNSADHYQGRPDPPDYNVLMAGRCNSLRWNNMNTKRSYTPLTFLNIPNFCLHDLYTHKFTWNDLEALIDIQERTLAAQKTELVRVELTLLDSKERELIQLRKQHNNLQSVLESLRNAEWPKCVEAESAEAERLNTTIAAMRTAVAEKNRELVEALNLQQTLERQLASEQSRAAKVEERHSVLEHED